MNNTDPTEKNPNGLIIGSCFLIQDTFSVIHSQVRLKPFSLIVERRRKTTWKGNYPLPLEKLTFRKVDTSRNDNVFIASEGLIHLYISATQNFLITVVGGFAILNNTRARITLTSTEVLSILYNHIKSMLKETRLSNQEWT